MKTIAQFRSMTEAFIAKGKLEIQGVECQLHTMCVYNTTKNYIKLAVLPQYQTQALKILKKYKKLI